MYMTDNFFVNLKSVSNFIFKSFGFIFSEQKTSDLLSCFGLTIKNIKTLPQREWLQPIYDDILVQVGDLWAYDKQQSLTTSVYQQRNIE